MNPLVLTGIEIDPAPFIKQAEDVIEVKRTKNVYVATINGKAACGRNGRTSWRRLGDAKNSIKSVLYYYIRRVLVKELNLPEESLTKAGYHGYNYYNDETDTIFNWMVDNKIIEFKQVV